MTSPGFSYAGVLPTVGSTSPLLLAAFACTHSMPLAQLAKAAGISRFAANRALPELLERGLLREDLDAGDGWYEYVPGNRHHGLLTQVAWRFSGVARSSTVDDWQWRGERRREEVLRYEYGHLLPPPGSVEETATRTGLLDGPDLVTGRDFTDWAGRTAHQLGQIHSDAQRVHGQWGNERFRDLIHQVLHLGGALGHARTLVLHSVGADAQGQADPYEVAIPAPIWARAMFLVSAEAGAVLSLVQLLELAISEGASIHTHRENALYALENASSSTMKEEGRAQLLQEAQDEATAARSRWADPPSPYAHIGGFPRVGDVGNGGDQLVVVQLLRSATMLTRQVASMTRQPGMEQQAAAAAQAGIQLVTEIPSGLLPEVRWG